MLQYIETKVWCVTYRERSAVAEDEELGGVGGSTGERRRGLWFVRCRHRCFAEGVSGEVVS